ncbi:xylulokinase [Marinilactibacillus piezotolerans]|uniref:xylulokinase n=1 Tax=Marinilactibacillus piezotolerans TaxID=258723 RepID=UPI0009B02328|nr:xylulokinase [Marinilactibacillus piezotolerans]
MRYVVGLDIGTSGLKGILVNENGDIVSSAVAEYDLYTPQKGYSEQDPDDWVKAAKSVLKEIAASTEDAAENIEAISFSGQMHSLVLLDENDVVLRKAILWNDVRTTRQCRMIEEKLGDQLIDITKNKALEGFTLPKLLWVKEHEPRIWEKVAGFLLPKDYVGFKLTGSKQMEYSDAAGTSLLDVENRKWSTEILDAFDISPEICPKLVKSQDKIGTLSQELAEKLNLSKDVEVFSGGADNACAALGAGIIHPHQAMASIGTSGVFLAFEPSDSKDYQGHVHYFNHVIPGQFYSMGVTLAAGNSLSWYKKTFAPETSYETLLEKIDNIDPGSNGLLFAPYITGERTPYTDSEIRGTFIGMDINHTRDHFTRSVLEGITFSLRDSYELMKEFSGKSFKEIVSVGGGSKNVEWLQMQADIFNAPVTTLKAEQGPALGAAMIAAVGARWFTDFSDCADRFVQYKKAVIPNLDNVERYNELYNIYREIYPSIKPISHKLAKF